MRSRLNRRIRISRSASGDGARPSFSRRASTNASIGFRTHAVLPTGGNGRPHRLHVGPVRRDLRRNGRVVRARGARVDPGLDEGDPLRGQGFLLEGHARGNLAPQALHEKAVVTSARHDDPAGEPALQGQGARVEAELVLLLRGPVAGDAVLLEEGGDVASVVGGAWRPLEVAGGMSGDG